MATSRTYLRTIQLSSSVNLFYREAGPASAPVILLLHGFPASSFQFRNLIPLLAIKYRIIAPDLPGFGFTDMSSATNFIYTFANLANVIEEFVDALSLTKFSIYIFDYGAPTGLRLALKRPHAIQAIISQNGNVFEEGFGDVFWNDLRDYWSTDINAAENRNALKKNALALESIKWQYEDGSPDLSRIAPETYYLDYMLTTRPGIADAQLDLFWDYKDNIANYPRFHEYFRTSQVPLLAVWGKNDQLFIPPGAQAYKRELPDAEVHLLDAGHFAVETNREDIADLILKFLSKQNI
ncbi:putative alpha beta [Phaeomoniella chlamydospora]|uniref:Putative alpha beta n=1 Tax=Phaeomoniella chlamydospora TaxID=158046 RepID=A0A0G2E3T3_PHACM|nr:putative alpha beta [Phaeomoniella chlamydospora]